MKNRQWQCEHGSEYAIPPELEILLYRMGFQDESWHNDSCPVFRRSRKGGSPAYEAVWCDHPDMAERETGAERFKLVRSDSQGAQEEIVFATDDAAEMMRFVNTYCSFVQAIKDIGAKDAGQE